MSRNLTLQLTIAALLAMLLVAATIIIFQYDHIEEIALETRKRVERQEATLSDIQRKLDEGISVSQSANPVAAQPVAPKAEGELLSVDPTPLVAPGAKRGGDLKLSSRSDYKGFNRLLENSAGVQELYYILVGNRLARRHYGTPDKWHGELATSIVPSNDFKTYHVKLRKGVKWHRPVYDVTQERFGWLDKTREMTADDFVFAIEMTRNEKVSGAAPRRSFFEKFDRIEVLNDHEFKVHWKEKVYLSKSVVLEMYPLPRWLYGADEDGKLYPKEIVGLKFDNHWYNDRAIGTGPFRFVESKSGELLRLARNDDYHEGKVALEGITFKIIKDPNTQLINLKKGNIDLMALTPTHYRTEILEATADSPFKTGQMKRDIQPRLAYRYLGWNARTALFSDKRVRRAMTHAFNRQKIIDEVFVGLARTTTGPFYIDTPMHDKSIQPLKFDLEKASALLDEAGWTDSDNDGIRDKMVEGQKTNFEFQLIIYSNFPEIKSAADILKEDLIKIGVKMSVTPLDWPTMQKKMEGREFEVYTGGWALAWEADPNQLWHSSQADAPKGSNFVGFKNPEADGLIKDIAVTFDLSERQKLFHRFHNILHEEQPYSFFMAPDQVIAYHKQVQNVTYQKPRPQILYHLMWKDE